MWDSLSVKIAAFGDEPYVLCGDFNEVREEDERLNCEFIPSRARRFNNFIASNGLIDLPLGGRKFTRVSEDGIKHSKLDRFLTSNTFNLMWSHLSSVALDRTLSDHCPILLKDEEKNFGPKPIKVFDEWLKIDGIEQVIKDSWLEDTGSGSRLDCLFRNKLKRLKLTLKAKCNQRFGSLDGEIETYKNIACSLELKPENVNLDQNETAMWKDARLKWMEKERVKRNMLKQKARVRWILEGDENTKYFHSLIRNRNNKNNINGISINGMWNEEPSVIKEEAFKHFSHIFE
ncbi:uncharacterized protein [Rutidosis leptorrhynchoides]|uniref:uncharacterized protein n=1 Tax=Rutidosis leptorrhynchoides TaxID=125765 RepID=UPI003A9A60FB